MADQDQDNHHHLESRQLRSPLWFEVAIAVVRLPTYFRIAVALHNMPDATMQYQPPTPPTQQPFMFDNNNNNDLLLLSDGSNGSWWSFWLQRRRRHQKTSWRWLCKQLSQNSQSDMRLVTQRPLSPRAIRRMTTALPNATKLERLSFDGLDLSDANLIVLCEALALLLQRQQETSLLSSSSSALIELSLCWNSISSAGIGTLMKTLAPHVKMATKHSFSLSSSSSSLNTLPQCEHLILPEQEIHHLQVLKLTGNPLGALGARKLAQYLTSIPSLKELHLGDCRLRDNGIKILSRVLPHSSIQTLRLDRNGITNDGAYGLAESMRWYNNNNSNSDSRYTSATANKATRCCLQVLHLTGNDIEWGGARELLEVSAMVGLQELCLGVNQIIRPRSLVWAFMPILPGTHFREALSVPCHLQSLRLNGNHLGDTGAILLADLVLRPSSFLRDLSLTGTRIGDEGATALASALRNNVHLERLVLTGNHNITEKGRAMFTNVIRDYNMSLRELLLDFDANISGRRLRIDYPIKLLHGMPLDFELPEGDLNYFIHLNAMGRKLVCSLDTPLSIWPFLLCHRSPKVVYAFLQYRPDIIANGSSRHF